MNVIRTLVAVALVLGVLTPASSKAADVTWDLSGVTFNDGGTASGSFVFNASTDTFISWSITTTATTNLAADNYIGLNGATYTTNNVTNASTNYYGNPTGTEFKTLNSADSLALIFAQALTNAGGTIGLTGSEFEAFGQESRSIVSGSVVSSVPLPGTLPLFGAAILGLAMFGMKKLRRSKAAA